MATIMRAAVRDGRIARSPVEVKGASIGPSPEKPVATVAEVGSLAEAVPARYRAMVVTAAGAVPAPASWRHCAGTAPTCCTAR